MKKTLIAVFALLILCLTLTALADTCGDYEYEVNADGTATITKYKRRATVLDVASVLDGHTVTAIGDDAFSWCTSLTGISIPESVSSIGRNPFNNCTKLTTINVSPDSKYLAVIDGVLFEKTEKRLVTYPCASTAQSYTVPNGIKVIGDGAFYYCESLKSISIPDSVTSIGDLAFAFCKSLTGISIPDSVTSIGDGAFYSCESLTGIGIPESVSSIGRNPFLACTNLTTINVSPDSKYLAVIDGVLFEKTEKRLVTYPCAFTAKSYTVPNGIKVIGDCAFFSCTSLTGISIPESVTSIGDSAFFYCTSLTGISIPESVTSIGKSAFFRCESLTATVDRDSYAKQYCIDNGINYTYADALDWLNS